MFMKYAQVNNKILYWSHINEQRRKKIGCHETKPSSANLSNLTLYSPGNKRQTSVCFTLILIFSVHELYYPATAKNLNRYRSTLAV